MGPRAISFRLVSATQASSASAACSYWHMGEDRQRRLATGSRDGAHGKLGMVGDMGGTQREAGEERLARARRGGEEKGDTGADTGF